MQDIFGKIQGVNPELSTCHSGGAIGSDTVWEAFTLLNGGKVNAYSYQTKKHNSPNKVEISTEDYEEGIHEINRANHYMNRWGIHKYMNLLARNWAQIKYSNQVIAIGEIVPKKKKNKRGYYNKGKYTVVDGGTGFAVMMGILHKHIIFVFDQTEEQWYKWSYQISDFVKIKREEVYIIDPDFAGIGTRDINDKGRDEIKFVFENTLNTLK